MSLVEEISTKERASLKRPSSILNGLETNESIQKNGRKSRSSQSNKINYNLAVLEAAAHGLNNQDDDEFVVTREEKKTQKRLQELDREVYNDQHTSRIEIPKTLQQQQQQQRRQTATVKRILNSKKQLNNYLDENESLMTKKIWNLLEVSNIDNQVKVPKLLICSICGNNSKYKCIKCQIRFCSVKCGRLHSETRCNSYV